MMKKMRTIGISLVIVLWAVLSLCLWFGKAEDYTYSERRKLAQFPEITASNVLSGNFMEDFEDFTLDQFPLRDGFRKVKPLFSYKLLNQADNNGIYLVGDMVAKIEYPLNLSSVSYATDRLNYLYEQYLQDTDCKVYAAVIPDKGYYLAEANGYPAMDYDALMAAFRQATPWAEQVEITQHLSAQDYYRTDTHWRQEKILDVAQALCDAMGVEAPKASDYSPMTVDNFYGVYFGQAALPMKGEKLVMLESELLQNCTVTDLITGETSPVYAEVKSADLYDAFLSGAQPLLTVENPAGDPNRELVIFRDSFGSSITPLLLQGYSKVHLVDIRYISPDDVGRYLTFENQDVLMLYSTLILNNGRSLK